MVHAGSVDRGPRIVRARVRCALAYPVSRSLLASVGCHIAHGHGDPAAAAPRSPAPVQRLSSSTTAPTTHHDCSPPASHRQHSPRPRIRFRQFRSAKPAPGMVPCMAPWMLSPLHKRGRESAAPWPRARSVRASPASTNASIGPRQARFQHWPSASTNASIRPRQGAPHGLSMRLHPPSINPMEEAAFLQLMEEGGCGKCRGSSLATRRPGHSAATSVAARRPNSQPVAEIPAGSGPSRSQSRRDLPSRV